MKTVTATLTLYLKENQLAADWIPCEIEKLLVGREKLISYTDDESTKNVKIQVVSTDGKPIFY